MKNDVGRVEAELARLPSDEMAGEPGAPVALDPEGPVDVNPPWGVGEDSPMDEGSEPSAVPEGQRGERRAAEEESDETPGPDLGPTGPIETAEAGPGGPHEPSPRRTPFPHEEEGT